MASDSNQTSNDNASSADDLPFVWPRIRVVPRSAALGWLGRGFDDFLAAPAASLSYGVLLALMGYLLSGYYGGAVGIAFTTGFLLVGPFMAIGLYDISRRRERQMPVYLWPTLTAWQANLPAVSFYALILMLSLAVWMRVSVVIIAMFIPEDTHSLAGLITALGGSLEAWIFAGIYVAVGGLLAVLTFATSAIALPMLLDRKDMDAISAMIVSVNTVRANPAPMLLWAVIIVALTAAGFLSWFIGLVFVLPIIGHGTWHAYRETIEPV